ncbi:MAG: hypothetical protein SOI38_01565 [Eggerthellaceae bacterium]|jgi:hypothetical protein
MNGEANNPQRTRAADGDGRADASCDDARQRAESMRTADAPSTVGASTLDAWSARVLRCLAPDRRSVIGNALVAAFIALAAVGHSAIVRLVADTATLDPTASLIPLFICAFAIATSVVYPALGVGSTPFREAVGVPLQQLSLVVVAGGDLTDEQADELSQIEPLEDIVENYDPRTPEGVKFSGQFDDE